MPTYRALPRNLLALMGTSIPVQRYEAVTDLCPRDACDAAGRQARSARALGDSLVVYGHRVLPPALRRGPGADRRRLGRLRGRGGEVAAVDPTAAPTTARERATTRWLAGTAPTPAERSPSTQATRLVRAGPGQIDADPALHFIHVVLPHAPWFVTPWGTSLMRPMPRLGRRRPRRRPRVERPDPLPAPLPADRRGGRGPRRRSSTSSRRPASGTTPRCVVTADHGTSTIPPDVGRDATENNAEEVYRVPFFLKAAGQRDGTVVDDIANDGRRAPHAHRPARHRDGLEIDGHSLLDGSEATVEPLVDPDVERPVRGRATATRPTSRTAGTGPPWPPSGEHAALVGTPLSRPRRSASRASCAGHPTTRTPFASLPNDDGRGAPARDRASSRAPATASRRRS